MKLPSQLPAFTVGGDRLLSGVPWCNRWWTCMHISVHTSCTWFTTRQPVTWSHTCSMPVLTGTATRHQGIVWWVL